MSEEPKQLTLRILIVEDDPMMRIGLKHSLSSQPQLEIVGMAEDGYLGVEACCSPPAGCGCHGCWNAAHGWNCCYTRN
jgi:hypothetical protein